jgi:hypothetical protein
VALRSRPAGGFEPPRAALPEDRRPGSAGRSLTCWAARSVGRSPFTSRPRPGRPGWAPTGCATTPPAVTCRSAGPMAERLVAAARDALATRATRWHVAVREPASCSPRRAGGATPPRAGSILDGVVRCSARPLTVARRLRSALRTFSPTQQRPTRRDRDTDVRLAAAGRPAVRILEHEDPGQSAQAIGQLVRDRALRSNCSDSRPLRWACPSGTRTPTPVTSGEPSEASRAHEETAGQRTGLVSEGRLAH